MKNYWIYPFSHKTWETFRKSNNKILNVNTKEKNTAKDVKQGDYCICFLTGISRFIAILEITSVCRTDDNFKNMTEDTLSDSEKIKTDILYYLTPDNALSIRNFYDRLSIFQNNKSMNTWTNFINELPTSINTEDGEIIVNEIKNAEKKLNNFNGQQGI